MVQNSTESADIITQLTRRLITFRDERDWQQFQSLKNLLVSLSLEAAELLELGQWVSDDQVERKLEDPKFVKKMGEECADIFIYLMLICERSKIDLSAVTLLKIRKNASNYPVEKARGNAKKYTEL